MGKSRLVWSHVQLILANQSKVFSIGRMSQVPVNIEGLKTYAYFEMIDIFYDKNQYHAFLGINGPLITKLLSILKRGY